MMSAFGIVRRRGDHDCVDKLAEFDEPIHRQTRISYNLRQARLHHHPDGKNEGSSVLSPHQDVFDAAVLILTSQNKCLPDKRMKR